VPPSKKRFTLSSDDIEQLLVNETSAMQELVKNIEEDIAGHIVFPDPIAHYPNLIQSIQLLTIHEKHHFTIIKEQYNRLIASSEVLSLK